MSMPVAFIFNYWELFSLIFVMLFVVAVILVISFLSVVMFVDICLLFCPVGVIRVPLAVDAGW